MHKRNKQLTAFTLVELMVSMAIIAVLMGLAAFGISTALRVLRDNQRRDAVRNISTGLNAFYADNGTYPTTVTLTTTTFNVSATNTVPLNGVARPQASPTVTASGTPYCYSVVSDGFRLGAKLESGGWFMLGSSANTAPCTDTDIVTPTTGTN